MSVVGPENRSPLSPTEETLLRDQVLPILRTILPEGFVARSLDAIREAAEQSKKKHGMGFGGLLPSSGQIGISPITPKDYNLAPTWTFRTNWASTTWQTLVNAQTTSKYTHVVVLAYENLEPTPRTLALKEAVGGSEHPVIDLTEVLKSHRQIQPIEPYIIQPISTYTVEAFVQVAGYDCLKPWGFTVAPYAYLISKTFIA